MTTYIVYVPEVWYQQVRIEADSEDEAMSLVQAGNGEDIDNTLEYSHRVETTDWNISKES